MSLKGIRQYLAMRRSQRRFERAEQQLRQQDVSQWPVELQIAHKQQLNRLRQLAAKEATQQP